jgi:hypothetical protein
MSKFRPLYPEFKDLSDNELTRKLYADHGVPTRDLPNLWETLGTVSGIAVRIPLAMLILGTSLVWAFLGFRPHTGSSHEPLRRLRRRAKRVAARGTRDRERESATAPESQQSGAPPSLRLRHDREAISRCHPSARDVAGPSCAVFQGR